MNQDTEIAIWYILTIRITAEITKFQFCLTLQNRKKPQQIDKQSVEVLWLVGPPGLEPGTT